MQGDSLTTNIIGWVIDCLSVLLFYRELKNSNRKNMLIGLLFIFQVIPLYISGHLIRSMILRTLLRAFSSFWFLFFFKDTGLKLSVYFCWHFTCSIVSIQSVRPFLAPITGIRNDVILALVYGAIQTLILLVVSCVIPFSKTKKLSPLQIGILLFIIILTSLSKRMTSEAARQTGGIINPSAYPFMILLLSLILLMVYDRMFAALEEANHQEMIALGAEYQLNNLKDKLSAQDNVNRIYHDMKNHLLALRVMDEQNQDKNGYINSLIEEIDAARGGIETGNRMLNGFLHEKNVRAKALGVQMGVWIDVRPLSFMNPVDLCVIIGNAVDNAIEASEKVKEKDDRFINLRSSIFANQYVLTVSNSCADGNLLYEENGLPKTTKKDSSHHGIGIRSIQDTIKQYAGTLSFSKNGGVFNLTIMIPIEMDNSTKAEY